MTVASRKTNVFVVWAWTNGPNSLQRRQEASAASPPLAALPDPCRWCQVEGERLTWRQRSHLHELRAELLRGPKISTAAKPEKSAKIQPLKDSQCSKTIAFDGTFGPLTTRKKCTFTYMLGTWFLAQAEPTPVPPCRVQGLRKYNLGSLAV